MDLSRYQKALEQALTKAIDNARKGSLDDLDTIVSIMSISHSAIPKDINASLHDLAIEYIMKDVPIDGDYSRQAVRLGEFISHSFKIVERVSQSYELDHFSGGPNSKMGEAFTQLWPVAFLWAQYLRRAIVYLHRSDANQDICRRYAEGISAFAYASSRCCKDNVTGKPLCDPKASEFFIDFWISSDVGNVAAKDAASALCAFAALEHWHQLTFLDSLQSRFDSARSLAACVVGRARAAMNGMDFDAMAFHYGVLAMLVRAVFHPVRAALLEEDVVPFVVTSLTTILDANQRKLDEGQTALEYCLNIMRTICAWTHGGEKTSVPQSLKCGLLECYFKVGQIPGLMERINGRDVGDLLRDYIPIVMHLKSVSRAARRALSNISASLGNRSFATVSLSDSFERYWSNFEIVALEHTILRHVHDFWIHRDLVVYCGNALCPSKGPQQSFKKCAGCQHAIYCSLSCQRSDWKAHHRLECGIILENPSRSKCARRDKNYLLYWALVQTRRHLQGLRQVATKLHPDIAFEKIALYMDLTFWPIRYHFYPLDQSPYEGMLNETEHREVMHFRSRALQRVEQGDKGATMLGIHYEDGVAQSTKFFVVSLDKSVPDEPKMGSGWKSKRKGVAHKFDEPIECVPDFVDEIIELVEKTANGSNIWKRRLIASCVDEYFSGD